MKKTLLVLAMLLPISAHADGNHFIAAAGDNFGCVVRTIQDSSHGVFCWGDNTFGQLGLGTVGGHQGHQTTAVLTDTSPFTQLQSGVAGVGAGAGFACALTTAGAVWCWGNNASGQVGNGAQPGRGHMQILNGATMLSVGSAHACALVGTDIYCWGNNAHGQLGDGTTNNNGLAGPVVHVMSSHGPRQFLNVSAGGTHTCATTTFDSDVNHQNDVRTVACWGDNTHGQVGKSPIGTNVLTAFMINGPTTNKWLDPKSLSVGLNFSCIWANVGSQQQWCWGFNSFGQVIGECGGCSSATLFPTSSRGWLSQGSIAEYMCGTTGASQTQPQCWGDNTQGQFGCGSLNCTGPTEEFPGFLPSYATTDGVASGAKFTVMHAGFGFSDAYSSGLNSSFQLGDDTQVSRAFPDHVH